MRNVETFREEMKALRAHPHHKKTLGKLGSSDRDVMLKFIKENATLSRDDFEMKVNRLFIDQTDKPPKWAYIMELLSIMNSRTA